MKNIVKHIQMMTAVLTVGGFLTSASSGLAGTGETIEDLKEQIKVLDEKVRALERNIERDKEARAEKAGTVPVISAGASGFSLSSPDSNFVAAVHGVLQVDNRTFFHDGGVAGNDTFLLRRARPILQGTLFGDFDFLFVPDFGGSSAQVVDAYLNYRYEPWLQLRAGKFKVPVGLEQLQSDPNTLFNERSLVTDLVPNRDVGFQLWGDVGGGALSYAAGVFNGVGDARNTGNVDFENHREFAGRLFSQPFRKSNIAPLQGLGFGVAGSYGTATTAAALPATTGGTLPGYTTDGQQQFFAYTNGVADGTHWRLSPQAYYYHGPFGLLAEYVISNQRVSRTVAPFTSANLEQSAWQVTASWVMTGEKASFTGVTPKRPFDPRTGKWGALQLVGRCAELDVDNDAFPAFANPNASASAAQAWSVGLNWYLNRNLRVSTSFSHTTFTGGGGAGATAPAAVTRQNENALFSRVQLAF